MAKVAIIRADDYSSCDGYAERLFELTGFDPKGKGTALLKPNVMRATRPEEAVVTEPRVIAALAKRLRKNGWQVQVGDGSGSQKLDDTDRALDTTGIRAASEGIATVLNFDDFPKETDIGNPKIKKIKIAEPALNADLLVSVPKMKTHSFLLFTGAVKNMFGCVYNTQKRMVHAVLPEPEDFAGFLVDLYTFVKPKFSVMDGILAMEGDGPSAGTPVKANVMLASEDGFALDYAASKLAGYDPMSILTTKIAVSRGLLDPKEIELVGDDPASLRIDLRKPATARSAWNPLLRAIPKSLYQPLIPQLMVHHSKCTKCSTCAKKCPVGAIKLDPYPVFDRKRCIRCFCCHEVCPATAIYLGGGLAEKLGVSRKKGK